MPKKTDSKPGKDGPPQPPVTLPALRPFKLVAGNIITIYVDATTRKLAEGPAKLICPAADEPEPSGLERWQVRFNNAPGCYRRYILPLTAEGGDDSPQPSVESPAEPESSSSDLPTSAELAQS